MCIYKCSGGQEQKFDMVRWTNLTVPLSLPSELQSSGKALDPPPGSSESLIHQSPFLLSKKHVCCYVLYTCKNSTVSRSSSWDLSKMSGVSTEMPKASNMTWHYKDVRSQHNAHSKAQGIASPFFLLLHIQNTEGAIWAHHSKDCQKILHTREQLNV